MLDGQNQIFMLWEGHQLLKHHIGVFLSLAFDELPQHLGPAFFFFLILHLDTKLNIIQVHCIKTGWKIARLIGWNNCGQVWISLGKGGSIFLQHLLIIYSMFMQGHEALAKEFDKNENNIFLKQLIKIKSKEVEDRVYWFNTVDEEANFLEQYWNNQVSADPVLKNRIIRITDDKLSELFAEVEEGKLDNDSMHDLSVEAAMENVKLSELAEDIPFCDHKYFSQNHPKTKQVKEKIRKIQQQQNQFKKQIEMQKKREEEKKREKAIMDQQIKQSIQKQKRQRYKEQVYRTLQEKSQKKKQREDHMAKFKEFMKVYKSSKPMHVLMEEEYTEKFVLPTIEENKKKLEEFHAKTKPSLEQINEHERNYLDARAGRESRIEIAHQTIDVFKSRFYLEQEKKMMEGDDYQALFDQMEKKKRYSEIVKQNFKPKISRSLRNSIHESTMKQSSARQSLDRSSLVERGKLYLQYMRSLEKNRQRIIPMSEMSERQRDQNLTDFQNRYVNYLQDFKQSRTISGNNSTVSREWEKDMKNKTLNDVERRERVMLKSKQLEEKAYRQEQFVTNNIYGKPQDIIQKKRQIDDKIISSIRAKVALLKDAQGQS